MGFQELARLVKTGAKQSIAVAWAADAPVLQACCDVMEMGLIDRIYLTGVQSEIERVATEESLDISGFEIVATSNPQDAAATAVSLVREGKATILMKGLLSTSILLKAVLNKEAGLRKKQLLSHVGIIEFPDNRLVLLTDGGMNIRPDLEQKVQIVENAVEFAQALGIATPKVAMLAAVETVNPKMPETLDAAAIVQMGRRGQFGKNVEIDGPLAFDNAVNKEAAEHKGIVSEVAGKADILMVPEIVAGNVLYKSFTFLAHLKGAGAICGASCPIVLTSRADSRESKVNSIMIACKAAQM